MTGAGATRLRGADPDTVRRAIERGEALPGTRGFAGAIDGRLVRDAVGRVPLFAEADAPLSWSFDPQPLDQPRAVPPGVCRDERGDRHLWPVPEPEPVGDIERGVNALRGALDAATTAIDADGLGVAFSGGLDSALLAARLDAPLFAVGFPGSPDLAAARDAARSLDRSAALTTVSFDHERLEATIPDVVRATGRLDPMSVSIALPLVVAADAAGAAGLDRLALGQGADELLGGYDKVARAPADPRVAASTVGGARREVVETLPAELERDVPAIRARGLEPVAPFLHDDVVSAALALEGDHLVGPGGERKWALRLAVREWLPDSLVFRRKRAIQYGSRVSRELDRLARQAGFKRRQDDHCRRYVASLC